MGSHALGAIAWLWLKAMILVAHPHSAAVADEETERVQTAAAAEAAPKPVLPVEKMLSKKVRGALPLACMPCIPQPRCSPCLGSAVGSIRSRGQLSASVICLPLTT